MQKNLPAIIILTMSGLAIAGIIPEGGVLNPLSPSELKLEEETRGIEGISIVNNENGHGSSEGKDCDKEPQKPKKCNCGKTSDESLSSSEEECTCDGQDHGPVIVDEGCVCEESGSSSDSSEQCKCPQTVTTTTTAATIGPWSGDYWWAPTTAWPDYW